MSRPGQTITWLISLDELSTGGVTPCRASCTFNIRALCAIRLRRGFAGTGVMSRGNRREDICLDDVDRQDFLWEQTVRWVRVCCHRSSHSPAAVRPRPATANSWSSKARGGDGFVPASCCPGPEGSGDEAVPAPFLDRPWLGTLLTILHLQNHQTSSNVFPGAAKKQLERWPAILRRRPENDPGNFRQCYLYRIMDHGCGA
jgi:hypothetical protein